MRVENTAPEPGTVFDWDIAEILERSSGDLEYYEPCICPSCGEVFLLAEGYCCGTVFDNFDAAPLTAQWEAVLEHKRNDEHYALLVDTLSDEGFTKPLRCYFDKFQNLLVLSDGHHRLAAAIDMGLDSVPVEVHWEQTVEDDSGSWGKDFYGWD